MQRIRMPAYLNPSSEQELFRQVAYHEAGHAVAICLRNQQLGLPPVYFEIAMDALEVKPLESKYLARVEGGRLLHNVLNSAVSLTESQRLESTVAIEADIVNLLAGPLAEARYVSLRDNESYNHFSINLEALNYYGGESDLDRVNHFCGWLAKKGQSQQDILDALFMDAYVYVNNAKTWRIISHLAEYIIGCKQKTIDCEHVFSVIEQVMRQDEVKPRFGYQFKKVG